MKVITPELIKKKCDQLAELLIQKNKDYGNSVQEQFLEYGTASVLIRVDDKKRRLKNLEVNHPEVITESKQDTALDGAGYFLLLSLLYQLQAEVEE